MMHIQTAIENTLAELTEMINRRRNAAEQPGPWSDPMDHERPIVEMAEAIARLAKAKRW